MDFNASWAGIKAFISEMVTMPNASDVHVDVRYKQYPRYRAPHVPPQYVCAQLSTSLPGYDVPQPASGCDPGCANGCVPNLPSMHNPGPSFTSLDGAESVNLIRIHKATAHYTCVRALLILQRRHIDPIQNEKQRHTYALARVLMKPAPGNAEDANTFYNNIILGKYSSRPSGYWQEWQTGTTGLRNMDPSRDIQYTGVTMDNVDRMPLQMNCWDVACLGKSSCQNAC